MCAKQAARCSAQPRAQRTSRCNELVICVIYRGACRCSLGFHPPLAGTSVTILLCNFQSAANIHVVFAGALILMFSAPFSTSPVCQRCSFTSV